MFDSERYDTSGFHTAAANSGQRLTVPNEGYYRVGGTVRWGGDAAGSLRQTRILLNGTTPIALQGSFVTLSGSAEFGQNLSTDYRVNSGNYFELQVLHDKTGGMGVGLIAEANTAPEFWIHFLGSG